MTKEEGGDRVNGSALHKTRMGHMCVCMGVHMRVCYLGL